MKISGNYIFVLLLISFSSCVQPLSIQVLDPMPRDECIPVNVEFIETKSVICRDGHGVIKGKAIEESEKSQRPLMYHKIYVRSKNKILGTNTDTLGNFSFEVPQGRYKIYTEGFGYCNSEIDSVDIHGHSENLLVITAKDD